MMFLVSFFVLLGTIFSFASEPPLEKNKLEYARGTEANLPLARSQERVDSLKRLCAKVLLDVADCKKAPDRSKSGNQVPELELGYYQGDTFMIDSQLYGDFFALKKDRVQRAIKPTTIAAPYRNTWYGNGKEISRTKFIDDYALYLRFKDGTHGLLAVGDNLIASVLSGKDVLDVKNGKILAHDKPNKLLELYRYDRTSDEKLVLVGKTPFDTMSHETIYPCWCWESTRFAFEVEDTTMVNDQIRVQEMVLGDHRVTLVRHSEELDVLNINDSLILTDRFQPASSDQAEARSVTNGYNYFTLHQIGDDRITQYPDTVIKEKITNLASDQLDNPTVFKPQVALIDAFIEQQSIKVIFEMRRRLLSTFGLFDVQNNTLELIKDSEEDVRWKKPLAIMRTDRIIRASRKFFSLDKSRAPLFYMDYPLAGAIMVNPSQDLVLVVNNNNNAFYIHPVANPTALTEDQIETAYDLRSDTEAFEQHLLDSIYANRVVTQEDTKAN